MKASHITATYMYKEIVLINKIPTDNPANLRYTAKKVFYNVHVSTSNFEQIKEIDVFLFVWITL